MGASIVTPPVLCFFTSARPRGLSLTVKSFFLSYIGGIPVPFVFSISELCAVDCLVSPPQREGHDIYLCLLLQVREETLIKRT